MLAENDKVLKDAHKWQLRRKITRLRYLAFQHLFRSLSVIGDTRKCGPKKSELQLAYVWNIMRTFLVMKVKENVDQSFSLKYVKMFNFLLELPEPRKRYGKISENGFIHTKCKSECRQDTYKLHIVLQENVRRSLAVQSIFAPNLRCGQMCLSKQWFYNLYFVSGYLDGSDNWHFLDISPTPIYFINIKSSVNSEISVQALWCLPKCLQNRKNKILHCKRGASWSRVVFFF